MPTVYERLGFKALLGCSHPEEIVGVSLLVDGLVHELLCLEQVSGIPKTLQLELLESHVYLSFESLW